MTADLVNLANFSIPSIKSLFALACKKQFSAERKIYYTKPQPCLPKKIIFHGPRKNVF